MSNAASWDAPPGSYVANDPAGTLGPATQTHAGHYEPLRPTFPTSQLSISVPHCLTASRQVDAYACSPATQVVVYSIHSDDVYMTAALQAGASGFVAAAAAEVDLVLAVREALSGGFFASVVVPPS